MKILNRPMFRYGGPIKEGIMDGIQEPKRGRVDGPGSYAGRNFSNPINRTVGGPQMVFPAEIRGMMPSDASKVFADVSSEYQDTNEPLQTIRGQIGESNTTDKKISVTQKRPRSFESSTVQIDNPNYQQPGTWEMRDVPRYGNKKVFIPTPENQSSDTAAITGGKSPFNYTVDEVIKEKDTVIDTEGNRKKSINNILEKLGYARSQKNALYDALIAGGQRISREGLGKTNLVNDLIADTSTAYDKPQKIREAAELMQVQQDLKLEGIDRSKVNSFEEKINYLIKNTDMTKREAIDKELGNPTSSNEAFEIWNDKSKDPAAAVRVGVEYAVDRGEFEKPIGVIDSKKYEEGEDFLKTNPEAGNYIFNGRIINISDTGKATTIKTFYRKRKEDTWLGSLFGSKEEIIG